MNELAQTVKRNPRERIPIKSEFVPNGWLSFRETVIADEYVKSFNVGRCIRVCIEATGRPMTERVVRWMLEKPHIQGYIKERMELAGWAAMTKEEYLKKLREIGEGVKDASGVSLKAWEIFGKAKGWLTPEVSIDARRYDQINFVQSDGVA